jgi:hypothetical protein
MGYLILMGVVFAFTAALLGWRWLTTRGRSWPTAMVRIAMPSGDSEAKLQLERLRQAGVRCRMQAGGVGYEGHEYWELWVREKDAELAREVLGLGH